MSFVKSACGKSRPIDRAVFVFSLMLFFSLIPASASAARLHAGFASPSLNVAMLWITQEGKLFEKNGVDVVALYLESTLAQKALIAGNIDFAMMTAINMAAPKLAGADLIMLAGFVNRFTYRLVVRPEINAASELKGKRIGIFRFGSAADRASRLVLAKFGLDPEKDVTYVQTPGTLSCKPDFACHLVLVPECGICKSEIFDPLSRSDLERRAPGRASPER